MTAGEFVDGRPMESVAIVALLTAPGPRPAALLLSGEAGIGKSSLVNLAIQLAASRSLRTLVATPSEMGSRAPFAVVTDLTAGLNALVEDLPVPQRRALRVATLDEAPGSGLLEPHAVGVAVRNVFLTLASRGPLVLVIDDAHWVDEASRWVFEPY